MDPETSMTMTTFAFVCSVDMLAAPVTLRFNR